MGIRKPLEVGRADILVGIPSYNNVSTIAYVIDQVSKGLDKFFPGMKSVIVVSDGNSNDGTFEIAKSVNLPKNIHLIAKIYDGVPGKGSAIKLALKIAKRLGCRAMAMVDSDLRSITPEWMHLLIKPIFEGTGLTTPRYSRYKYDGTITNQVIYPFTLSLFGVNIRQPIGGDFGLSKELIELMINSLLWRTPYTPRFGIDISITHTALAHDLEVKEAFLGSKIHDVKDPTKHLGPMFKQVIGALFTCTDLYFDKWKNVNTISDPNLIRGSMGDQEPEPFEVGYEGALDTFKCELERHQETIQRVLPKYLLQSLKESSVSEASITAKDWARITYHFANYFNQVREEDKDEVIEAFKVCWIGRVGNFVKETLELSNSEAEAKIISDAMAFVQEKPYLVSLWCNKFGF
ncbi:MAG: glycosyltransferase [Nitrososphaeria archaeon]